MDKKDRMFEIWGDIVEIRPLIISIFTSAILTMGAYFLAPSNGRVKQLFFGLAGAVLGFVISAHFIKPKRIVITERSKRG
ncbi:MAG: hypothetical protein GX329_06560 [Tissierellia bacterium]|nr:hypothetical protein [Tissierellia bacterium]